jgi:Cu/Ag efflux protein CusF
MNIKNYLLVAALFVSVPAFAGGQKMVTKGNTIKATATIVQIDSTTRHITFKSDDGTEDSMVAGPEIQRFSELKVGDKVNLTYYESTVYQLRKAGSPSKMSSESASLAPSKGAMPGGTMAVQSKSTVTVKSIDMKIPSITVVTADGRTVTRKVDDKKNLEGVKAGDKIDITYTEAIIASVDRK